jgi:hypothetical protein
MFFGLPGMITQVTKVPMAVPNHQAVDVQTNGVYTTDF